LHTVLTVVHTVLTVPHTVLTVEKRGVTTAKTGRLLRQKRGVTTAYFFLKPCYCLAFGASRNQNVTSESADGNLHTVLTVA